ncbi:MAG: hypothetical protein OK404_03040 [Thaumarchaeota archaeon]|nr:hypothetical protein [Nitrososphaerota archaeon]
MNQSKTTPMSSSSGTGLGRINLLRAVSLALFVFGLAGSVIIFTDVQVMNGIYHVGNVAYSARGFPWWTERVTEQLCFVPGPNDNCGFINYGQALGLGLAASSIGFFLWEFLSDTGMKGRGRVFHALGLSLLLYGLLVASVIFAEVQFLNGIYQAGGLTLSFQGFPGGGQEALGSSCLVGADPFHCVWFSYDELLYLSSLAGFVGLILWGYAHITEGWR